MSDNITITEQAKAQIIKLSQKHTKKYVRFAVTAGGCNGFNKVWSLDDITNEDDQVFDCSPSGLIIDNITLDIIPGAIIDYKQDMMGSYFTVDIPSATSSCGCGSSFSL